METEVLVLIAGAGGAIVTKVLDVIYDHFKGRQARALKALELEHETQARRDVYEREQTEGEARRQREDFVALAQAVEAAAATAVNVSGGVAHTSQASAAATGAFVRVVTATKNLAASSGSTRSFAFAELVDSSVALAKRCAARKPVGTGVHEYDEWWGHVQDVIGIGAPED